LDQLFAERIFCEGADGATRGQGLGAGAGCSGAAGGGWSGTDRDARGGDLRQRRPTSSPDYDSSVIRDPNLDRKVKSELSPAPDRNIPWLLVPVAANDDSNNPGDLLKDTTFIQRINTQGGTQPPAASCKAQTKNKLERCHAMARDQSALLEVLDALKVADVDGRSRSSGLVDQIQSEVDRADPRLIEQAAARLRHRDHRCVRGLKHKHLGASSCLSDRVDLYERATARDDGRVNRRTVRALVVVLGTIGILSAGSGVASAELAARSQSRASEPGCVWFWWIDRWICRDVDDPPSSSGHADADDGDQPDGRRAQASEAERGQRAGRTADPPPTRGTADDSDGGDARRTEGREGVSG
jgi:Protein of unknown function (DUF3455)